MNGALVPVTVYILCSDITFKKKYLKKFAIPYIFSFMLTK